MASGETGPDQRGSAPVIGDVLMVGVGVVAATIVAVLALDMLAVLPAETPVVAASADPYVVGPADTCGVNEVTLRHEEGAVLPVESLVIAVSLPDSAGATARVSGFPVANESLSDATVTGNRSILSADCVGGALATPDGRWSPGSPLLLQLDRGVVDPGDRITVRVFHRPSGTNVTTVQLVAETA